MNGGVRIRRHGPFCGALDPARIAAYAEATGDTTPAVLAGDAVPATLPVLLVFDAARAAGFDYLFAHGLCIMAMCTHGVLDAIGVGDPLLVWRVAVRFAAPMPLGADLTTRTYRIDGHAFAFDAHCGNVGVVSHGRLELHP